jgi:NAD(P)-dependent dehydrogenase (short-subunit alcohol dehydrogenase family)
VAYAAAKGGVLSFAQAAAVQLGPRKIRVNSVCPGPTRTPSFVAAVAAVAERDGVGLAEAEAGVVASFQSPLGRVVEPSEIAAAVAFLASEDAAAITGQTLNVDGGLVFD